MGNGDELERAFAGATVHDMFNFMTVAILFPIEIITHYLAALTWAIVRNVQTQKGEKWSGPVKKLVGPVLDKVIIANKKLIEKIAENDTVYGCGEGQGFYPIECSDPANPTYESCEQVGLIDCNKDNGECPAFFQATATVADDKVSGGVSFILGLVILFICLFALVAVLQKMLMGMSSRIIYKATDLNGYVSILIGAGITIVVQSSSITTSALTPLVGIGVIRLEQMYPLTLGANVGTTMTALMAAMVTEGTNALQVALAHLFFNLTGILIFFPIPFMRRIPIHAARQLGKATRLWRGFPLLYIAVMFFLVELFFLGLSIMFEQKKKGLTVLASVITVVVGLLCIWLGYWCQWRGGKKTCAECFQRREKRRLTQLHLPEDMARLKAKINALVEYTGLPVEDEDEEVEEEEMGKKGDPLDKTSKDNSDEEELDIEI